MHTRPTDIATWLRNSVSAAGAEGLVVPLDGRIGSALTARLCQMAMDENAVARARRGWSVVGRGARRASSSPNLYRCDCSGCRSSSPATGSTAALGGTIAGSGVPP